MIKYLITIVLTIALCCSCDREDFSADPTIMPPATQTGANTFGCLIDGCVYTGQLPFLSTSLTPKRKTSLFTVSQKERVTIRLSILMLYSKMKIIKKKNWKME